MKCGKVTRGLRPTVVQVELNIKETRTVRNWLSDFDLALNIMGCRPLPGVLVRLKQKLEENNP